MRAAPPVRCVSRLDGGWLAAVRGLSLAAVAVTLGWLAWHLAVDREPALSIWLAGALALLPPAWLAVQARRLAACRQVLAWTGSQWLCAPADPAPKAAPAGRLDLMLDLGGAMLLRWHPLDGAPARWLPVRRGAHDAAAWQALRVAVRHSAPDEELPLRAGGLT